MPTEVEAVVELRVKADEEVRVEVRVKATEAAADDRGVNSASWHLSL
jgi:hypothetical protein